MRWWIGLLCTRPTCLVGFLLCWSNSSRVEMSPHWDTLSWSRANQSLLFFLNAMCFVYVICVCLRLVNSDVHYILCFLLFFSCCLVCQCLVQRGVQHVLRVFVCLHLVHGGIQYCVVYFALEVFVLCLVASFSRLSILHYPFGFSTLYFEYIWCFAKVISAW